MADVNKSVEISYRADIKQLEKTLRAGGKLSEKQIKEMIGGLNKQLRQTEKAAKKAATETKKSMRTIELSAEKAERSLEELHGSAGDVGSVMGQLAGAAGLVSPEMEGIAMATADAVGGLEGLAGIGKFINPYFAAFAVLAAGAAYAVSEYSAAQERAAKAAEELAKEQEELNKKLEDYHRIQAETIGDLGEFTTELNLAATEVAMLSGQISQAEFVSMQRDLEANKIAERLRQTAQDRIDALNGEQEIKERNLELAKQELQNLKDHRQGSEGLLAEFRKRAEKEQEIADIERELEKFAFRRSQLEEQVTLDYSAQAQQLINLRAQAEDLREQAQKREQALKEQNRQKNKQQKKNEELKAQEERLVKLQQMLDIATREQEEGLKVIADIEAKRLGKNAQVALSYKRQKEQIEASKNALHEQLQTAKDLAVTEEDNLRVKELEVQTAKAIAILEDEGHAQRIKHVEELRKLKDEAHEQALKNEAKEHEVRVKNVKTMADAVIGSALAIAQLHSDMNKEDIKAQQRLFRVNQAASVANIAMSAAEAIAKALALPPIVRGVTIAAIGAGAAAQTGIVMSQTPPTADMGGMIGNNDRLRPDESMVRVLRGEAILDRATVDRIGGAAGIQRLQEGQNTGQVVVVQPFKHFDRFVKQTGKTINNRQTRY